MKPTYYFKLFFLITLIWGSSTFATFSEQFAEQFTEQCFSKSETIEKVPGSIHLPKKVCFKNLEIFHNENLMALKIEGDPITGSFNLGKIKEYETYTKYMTYIFGQEHVAEMGKIYVTLRVSVDLIKDIHSIDYTYLAAEFFVPNNDGYFDTHIYYYKRN